MGAVTFRRAVREDVGLVVGIAGPSGSGKTFSAFRLAAGMSGNKPFAVIDTEAGRAKHYADRFAFDHADLHSPFRPGTYAAAIIEADKAGYPVIVVDSFSHEHAGDGGLLDWHEEELDRMAGQDYKRRDACKMAAWIKPKMEHKQMVSRLLQVRAHLILCFRAEQKIEIVRTANGTEIQPKKIASGFSDWIPVCERNILYELTVSFLLTPDAPGIPKPIKLQEQMREFVDLKAPLNEEAGKRMAEWAKGGTAKPVIKVPVDTPSADEDLPSDIPSEVAIFEHQLKNCPRTSQAINDIYKSIPEHLRQDLYSTYSQQLKTVEEVSEPRDEPMPIILGVSLEHWPVDELRVLPWTAVMHLTERQRQMLRDRVDGRTE